ncbi:sensor histidine kinase [Conexibacter sp. SYSU D00693]|uniref:sensor histidine kinase n=1 Tax=Conexibacter sp. SYSU D00693 TaxID=2812560 RepID=UPI001F11E436|nr:histidine kinase [Conexibacter sp. SYSU D00693]
MDAEAPTTPTSQAPAAAHDAAAGAVLSPALRLHAGGMGLFAAFCTLVWLASGAGVFWPAWVWMLGLTTVGVHATVRVVRHVDDPEVRRLLDRAGGIGRTVVASAGREAAEDPDWQPEPVVTRRLSTFVAVMAFAAFVCTVVWGALGGGYFWPLWVWFGGLEATLLWAGVRWALQVRAVALRRFAVQLAVSAAALFPNVWTAVFTEAGAAEVYWPLIGLGTAAGIHLLLIYRHALPDGRERQLEERVTELTRTRRGALDVQAAELRRIERDLHDGAQARLVALTMKLGRAEARLEDRPEVAELLREAREDAGSAIAELRDLARGIAPPVLADRGLEAAVDALAQRAAIPVEVVARLTHRPPPVVETAAYFVTAEALTNVAKHAGGSGARVRVVGDVARVVVEVADDGPGGAVVDGGGLTGLRHRVEALDGALEVHSPAGGGTTIRAVLPCGS